MELVLPRILAMACVIVDGVTEILEPILGG